MATSIVKKINVRANLDNGVDAQGNVKTVAVSLPAISVTGYDDDKALAIVSALEPCLDKTVYSTSKVVTNDIEE